MKSIIFCTSFIKDSNAWGNRYQRWLDYYDDIPIDAVKKILIDDGSPFLPSTDIIKTISHQDPLLLGNGESVIIRFDDNLGRQSVSRYPGWWRSFLHSIDAAKALGADKIIHIESDAYILSQQLVDFINQTQSGWHVLWTERYQFPETAIQVICRDQFENFEKFRDDHLESGFTDIAERLLPFSSVHRQFKGDRYSEFKKNRGIFRSRKFDFLPIFQRSFFLDPVPSDADFITQTVRHQTFEFRGKK
jgi:hypothetical protein